MKVMLDEEAKMPTRAFKNDAGLDLYSREEKVIFPRQITMYDNDGNATPVPVGETFDTGVHIAFDHGTYGKIESKSGLNVKHGLVSCGGVVDEGYTGSIAVKLYNLGNKPYTVHKGDKIAQLVIMPYLTPEIELVDTLEETDRGACGFGSSGR